jgi:peroxiredoxin
MTYRAPVADMLFAMKHAAGLQQGVDEGIYADLADGAAEALLDEAAKFAENRLAPINRNGDLTPAKLVDGVVKTLNVEGPGKFEVSDAATMLAQAQAQKA